MTPQRALREKMRRKRHFVAVLFFCILGSTLFFGVVWGLRQPSVRIRSVAVVGNHVVAADDISVFVLHMLSGYRLLVIPRDNALLYSDTEIANALLMHFKNFSTAAVSLVGFTKIVVTVEERTPVALWCGGDPTIISAPCFFIDKDGLIYAVAPTFSPGAYVHVYSSPVPTTLTDDPASPVGQAVFSPGSFVSEKQFTDRVGELLGPINALVASSTARTIMLTSGGAVRFSSEQNLDTLATVLSAAVATKQKEQKHDFSTLEYIDLGIADTTGRVYFKFK
ncbi:MAG: cell division protein FtsQ/DivIB [Minisyncoccota bacterium]